MIMHKQNDESTLRLIAWANAYAQFLVFFICFCS